MGQAADARRRPPSPARAAARCLRGRARGRDEDEKSDSRASACNACAPGARARGMSSQVRPSTWARERAEKDWCGVRAVGVCGRKSGVSAQAARTSRESVPQALHVQDALLGQAAATVEAWGAPRRLLGKRAAYARHGGFRDEDTAAAGRSRCSKERAPRAHQAARARCAISRSLPCPLDRLGCMKALGLGRHPAGLVEREAPSGLSPSIGVVTRGYEPELSGRGGAVGQIGLDCRQ